MAQAQSEQLEQMVLNDAMLSEAVASLANTSTESIRHMSKEFWEWVWLGIQLGLAYQNKE